MNPLVSVIITTRNEARNIRACLLSIQKQTYRSVELIIIDNASTDQTKEIAKELGASVYDKGPERSAQRNYGMKKAQGKYSFFLDADMTLTPRVIEECVHSAVKHGYLGVVIPERSIGTGFWAQCKALEREFYWGIDWIEAARFFQTDAFRAIGGYDEELTGPEDFDLPQRIKTIHGATSIGRVNAYIVHNEGRLTLAKTLQKKFYYGKKMDQYQKKTHNVSYLQKQSSLLNRYMLFFSKPGLLFRYPIRGMGMLFMKTAEMGALALGYLSSIRVKAKQWE
ncbi:hypothetical protein A2Z00_02470 [Candidatus Gottesmanbacteria bacterium RBG_13_45_10]|uniref:Glycosyltransferase 2-like domain-containing protein n=1 Tax=Candidatus Gottesmanbacteria bacterium RBG_13_45_10 TaxID=1798370 RepID=A0A1F5ZFN8_9BACT|nr:MAG: hypothetical protein A2Z00_02470 [Candidatus Gottesmanbacteria bacterium RBG_13_45_10]